jgi:hypothetical protein
MFCPQCGTSLPDYAVKCTSCGAAVPAAAPVVAVAGGAAPVPALAGARETKTCPFCGEEILKSAIRCRFCQADLQAGVTSQNLQAPAPNQNSTGITVQGPQLPANQPTIVIQNVQTQQGPPMIRQYKNPGVALALAIIFPGAGQFYKRTHRQRHFSFGYRMVGYTLYLVLVRCLFLREADQRGWILDDWRYCRLRTSDRRR